ncbi:unnamed protein product [Hermetia illucens]|uniref:von Hippel-Lindau disease tumour suppressor beta domain-containing protein n=1 Tax=Hermetia illucens TaxID=343691 RepID=A0A7R8UC70_HERIL|nr:protein Vhl [Hermetia illucens]CAD7078009.1 unnamed protein product [Hermetia illucens]
MQHGPNLRSSNSIHHSFVIFANTTKRKVDVFWVDYEGKFVHYMCLKPDDRIIVNTFSTHPWIFIDSETGERMHVEHSEIFWPKPSIDASIPLEAQRRTLRRSTVNIHFPLRTLQDTALWTIVKEMVRNVREVETWEIPRILKVQVINLFTKYEKHRQSMEAART